MKNNKIRIPGINELREKTEEGVGSIRKSSRVQES